MSAPIGGWLRSPRLRRTVVSDLLGPRGRAAVAALHMPATRQASAGGIQSGAAGRRYAREEFIACLRSLGVETGDMILVHSSASQLLGRTPSVADFAELIDALTQTVGTGGTVVMPTQSIRNPFEFAREGRIFEPTRHVSIFGALTEAFRRADGAVRGLHPWCNLTARGARAREILDGDERCSPFAMGVGSPWERLARGGAKAVFLGVDITVNTLYLLPHHLLGDDYPLPVFFDKPLTLKFRRPDGTVGETQQRLDVHDWSKDQVRAYAAEIDAKYRLYRHATFGPSSVTVFDIGAHTDALIREAQAGNCYSRPRGRWRAVADED